MKGQAEVRIDCPSCGAELVIQVHLSDPVQGLTIVDGGMKKLLVTVTGEPPHHFCPGPDGGKEVAA